MGRPKLNVGDCINGCASPRYARQVCRKCYRKLHYEEHERERRGATKNPEVGDRRTDLDGYVRVKMSNNGRDWKDEHRLVMETYLGRPLAAFENVHHKNGVKDDNRLDNLELWVTKQPKGQRPQDLIEYAQWILQTYN